MSRRSRIFSVAALSLVVLLLGGALLLGLIFPAIQRSREESRLAQCSQNLSFLARGAQQYEDAQGSYPSITCNSEGIFPSWAALVAPFADVGPALVFSEPADSSRNLEIITEYQHPIWQCPTRRAGARFDFPASFAPGILHSALSPSMPTDYAAGHSSTDDVWSETADGLIINPMFNAVGKSLPVSAVSLESLNLQQSYTALLGEKHMRAEWLGGTVSADDGRGLDIPALAAMNSPATIRMAGDGYASGAMPLAAGPEWGFANHPRASSAFGSWHIDRCQFVRADGSVREYSTKTDVAVLRRLISRAKETQDAVPANANN